MSGSSRLDSGPWDHAFAILNSSDETPPPESSTLVELLLHLFANHPFLFLDAAGLHHAALLPAGHPDLLSAALLHAVHLWASYISQQGASDARHSEEAILARTTHHLSREIGTIQAMQPMHRILELIQAELLLSLYYLDSGLFTQGKYHCAGATSMALSAGLHQMGGPPQTHPPLLFYSPPRLPPDSIRAKEMIDAFWSVVMLNNYWVAASGEPSCIPDDASITTPWPTHEPIASLAPTQFRRETPIDGHSPRILLVQASILLERTIAFMASHPGLPHPPDFWALDHRLETFQNQLLRPPISTAGDTNANAFSLVTHAFVSVAIIRLHAPDSYTQAAARAKCFAAATCVTSLLNNTNFFEWDQARADAEPILGPLLYAISEFYISHAQIPTPFHGAAQNLGNSMNGMKNTVSAMDGLEIILSAMTALARYSPLIHHCLAAAQQRCVSAKLLTQI
ncbi:hypothetical protein C8R44DRAFT_875294 [Mycena epipterygia]|nr:hypothetical protein C8R44DRAFT_875294 [Mycena epipterygia]